MKNLHKIFVLFVLLMSATTIMFAGNPDRQGEAGAAELLLNPWAKSAGLHGMSTASISGVESMRFNVAGLGRIDGKELNISNTRLFEGSAVKLNALGYAQKMGNSAFGISLMAVDFGDIPVTTVDQPDGTGATFSPSFLNLGIGYSYTYENKISVGILFRTISESTPDVSAFGFALDAGVQYVSGEQDNFRLGISLRNIGSPMKFNGQGLSFQGDNPDGNVPYLLTFDQRSEDFELPSVLNIGISYDFHFNDKLFLRTVGNFTSNAFSRDQIGAGAELYFNDMFILRGGYKKDFGSSGSSLNNVYSGVSAGASIELPFNDSGKNKIAIDYAYRATNPFRGTHNFSVRMLF
ncbi:MAG: PorV/PorQ family protein [Saprospiraceae bacterium]|nr:PorV/PorQ family protein [Bacteroidia bacterium]NNE13614.1 PorV/PorQ family protein [Saprospiraceae bacterium]NNL91433.1 PorV/PorQ family protein [Saprospiraceae bacterium]